MKLNKIIIFALLVFLSTTSAYANDKLGIILTSYDQPKSDLAIAFQNEALKRKGIYSKALLMLEVHEEFQLKGVDLSKYDSILLLGDPKGVESTMMTLLGFGVSSNALILDNIHGDITVKRRIKTDIESDIDFAESLLNMLL